MYEICIDRDGVEYFANVKVTHSLVVAPNYRADNPSDYYGYSELEWETTDEWTSDEDGERIDLKWVDNCSDLENEKIEEQIWKHLDRTCDVDPPDDWDD